MNIIENQAEEILKKTINNYKSTNNKYFILCDTITEKLCLPILESICETSFSDNLIVINYGEKNKNIDSCMHIWQQLLDKNATRQSILCCLGGGIVCDMGAFVAATFKRGIPYILIPTTLIAQIDALQKEAQIVVEEHQEKKIVDINARLEKLLDEIKNLGNE